ncbi:transposase family protein [Mycobacterium canetti]|uniref:transposase family protein n=1 Tax=Mycobacterium canetti TaxID=78331 RepID=UPI00031B5805|nr:transposase family protein [Mycobacterium canetti]
MLARKPQRRRRRPRNSRTPARRREILGDGGYRGIDSITSPARDKSGRIIRDDQYRAHRRIRARVEHVIARIKDWQIL